MRAHEIFKSIMMCTDKAFYNKYCNILYKIIIVHFDFMVT